MNRTNKIFLTKFLRHRFASTIAGENDRNEIVLNKLSGNYCYNLVRQHDYENFLCTLLMKDKCRQSAIAIRAFNVEISKISSVVSDEKILRMRLKFWYDAIEKLFQSKQSTNLEHPVIKEIQLAIRDHNLQKMYFSRLIKCRERSSNHEFITSKELEQYAEESASSVYYLLAKILKCENINVDHAVSHLGKAHGIVNMLRAQCRLDQSKGVCIPQETMLKHGVNQKRILKMKMNDKGVQDCIFDVASLANSHLQKARDLSHKIPQHIKHLLLPAIAIERYLEKLRKQDFNISQPQLIRSDGMLPVALYWNFLRKKY